MAAQRDETALEQAARVGFRLVICNRPVGEEAGPCSSALLAWRSEALGIGFLRIPIRAGRFPEQDIATFRAAVADADGAVLGSCRSGSRSPRVWSPTADVALAGRPTETFGCRGTSGGMPRK